jgi:hypothetical protein
MQVNLLEPINIDVALFGLGKNKGVTSGMNYREFCCKYIRRDDGERKLDNDEFWTEDGLLGVRSPEYMQMLKVANNLSSMPTEHRKFLRQITSIAIEITAPRYFWSEFDTYKVGTTAQSESTMHTITKRDLSWEDFAWGRSTDNLLMGVINKINNIRMTKCGDVFKTIEIKKILPESFLQCRVVTMNYEVFKNMYSQRKNHKLPEWREFCEVLLVKLPHKNWIIEPKEVAIEL